MKKQCFIFLTRRINGQNRALLKSIDKQVSGIADFKILSYTDSSDFNCYRAKNLDLVEKHVVITRDDLLALFGNIYPNKISSDESWSILPGNLDLVYLYFAIKHKNYDYYWLCEDDVRFTGNYSFLLRKFRRVKSDLIATNIRKAPERWPHMKSIFTGNDHYIYSDTSAFLPFCRVSKKGFEKIDEAYRRGWRGHFEITWTNILTQADATFSDFNDHHIRNYYSSNIKTMEMNDGSFTFMPPKLEVGKKKNFLYHPIKKPHAYKKNMKWFKKMIESGYYE